jgi:acyl-homoserine-lactone acylase
MAGDRAVRSADGATRLLVNSHQPYTGPVAWYEAVVESGKGWHVAGGFFPGAPFMLHGHNATLGWANTVSKPDLVDIYRLTINPANKNQYKLDGQWKDFDKRYVTLRVKLLGPIVLPVKQGRAALGARTGAGDRSRRLRHPLRRHGRMAPAAAVLAAEPRPHRRGMARGHRHPRDPQPELRLCRQGRQHRLRPQRPVSQPHRRRRLGRHPARRPLGPGLARLSPGRADPAAVESEVGLVFNSNNSPFRASEDADNLKPETSRLRWACRPT